MRVAIGQIIDGDLVVNYEPADARSPMTGEEDFLFPGSEGGHDDAPQPINQTFPLPPMGGPDGYF
ncbi:MAG: hypothetical protein COT92_00080 [Candidatus Doudnabacteria bacterium CG10_big_fil_rev_8_21_14_0_10_42_18]|uniref:Uncharacterized protein n=1 Tax=Candidatus Doudnabacteria bacterium CG10_big_fil_rev_8_21_14_0_10_42_18 TaxID=1974552 RepID=A0A2H0VE61_9BACT|nr:MAG: hypothetical protein COT92_00080 [Candidatus Doudnabacteria bacterium CG10_big_fil_rev_8_21_14_0_10_42_18]